MGEADKDVGFYYDEYDQDGDPLPHGLVSTQFEEKAARMAFPCFDEPGIGVIFVHNLLI